MNRQLIIVIALCTSSFSLYPQTMKEKYGALIDKNSEKSTEQFLKQWENSYPDDAEMYSAYFNYYANKSIINSSRGTELNKIYVNKALEYADKGIKKFPSRLDMRFGKASYLLKINNYPKQVEEIIRTLNHSLKNQNNWTWTENKPLGNGLKTMIDGLQGYILQLYESKDINKIQDMLHIAETTFDYYPNDSGSMINLAIIYILTSRYDEALEILKEAEKITPTDFRILGNIAEVYAKKGDKANALNYYKRIAEVGNDEAKAYAKRQAEKLTNKQSN